MQATSITAPAEACDFCHAPLAGGHQHLLESVTRRLECVCDACAILFNGQGQKYLRVPRTIRSLPDFRMTNAQWDALMIPIGIAFLIRNRARGRVMALYPSPAGPVESLLSLDAWQDIEQDNHELRSMESDVEGLLAYRIGSAREHFIIPIDECFKLIGLIRLKWKGFSGGMEMWKEIGKFLETLKERSMK
jgi:Family of unknown function (DUF5947)